MEERSINQESQALTQDSRPETLAHIRSVGRSLKRIIEILEVRASAHDASKLNSPELELFNIHTPRLRNLIYGSEEYKESLASLGPALKHHYQNNSHHPEYYGSIDQMDLIDIVEMLCDWSAAVKRHKDGNLTKSLEINTGRFNISPQLRSILQNTIDRYEL